MYFVTFTNINLLLDLICFYVLSYSLSQVPVNCRDGNKQLINVELCKKLCKIIVHIYLYGINLTVMIWSHSSDAYFVCLIDLM